MLKDKDTDLEKIKGQLVGVDPRLWETYRHYKTFIFVTIQNPLCGENYVG